MVIYGVTGQELRDAQNVFAVIETGFFVNFRSVSRDEPEETQSDEETTAMRWVISSSTNRTVIVYRLIRFVHPSP